jgi:acetyl-CoA acetyltransferase
MGNCAELCADTYNISRQEMDDHAVEAFQRAQAATPFMQAELVPVPLPPSKQAPQGSVLDHDESLSKMNESKLRGLKPFFKQVCLLGQLLLLCLPSGPASGGTLTLPVHMLTNTMPE